MIYVQGVAGKEHGSTNVVEIAIHELSILYVARVRIDRPVNHDVEVC